MPMVVRLLGLLLPGVALGFSPRRHIVASRTAAPSSFLAMEICPEISTEPRRPKHEVVSIVDSTLRQGVRVHPIRIGQKNPLSYVVLFPLGSAQAIL